jgi:uncharacterized protein (TIGR00251 family)
MTEVARVVTGALAAKGAPAAPVIRPGSGGLLVGVRVSPSAPVTAVRGLYGERLKVSVSAPAEDNRANRELVEALAKWLGIRRDSVRVEAGHGSRDKVVAFLGVGETDLREKLTGLLELGTSEEERVA